MKEELGKLLGKFSDVLNILDFSYFISGSVATMILYWVLFNSTPNFQEEIACLQPTNLMFCLVIVAYSLGHIVGTLGRAFRFLFKWCVRIKFFSCIFYYDMLLEWNMLIEELQIERCDDTELKEICVRIEDCDKLSILEYVSKTEHIKIEYTHLWNYFSSKENVQHRITHINRFWGMQKMYEGLMIDALVASVATLAMYMTNCIDVAFWPMVVIVSCFLMAFFSFCYEANKCAKAQLNELLSACKVY